MVGDLTEESQTAEAQDLGISFIMLSIILTARDQLHTGKIKMSHTMVYSPLNWAIKERKVLFLFWYLFKRSIRGKFHNYTKSLTDRRSVI